MDGVLCKLTSYAKPESEPSRNYSIRCYQFQLGESGVHCMHALVCVIGGKYFTLCGLAPCGLI